MLSDIMSYVDHQPEGKSPKRTQYDKSSGNETFFDFVMNNIRELNEKTNLKYDLSKDLHAVIFMCRPITDRELITRTSETFCSSLTNNKIAVKVYEYFVYIPNISDYQMVPSIEEMEVFYRLKHASRALKDSDTNKDGTPESQELTDIKQVFPTQETREGVMNMIEEKIESLYRFYSVEEKTGSNLVNCIVRFHDENSLQYGKLRAATTPLEIKLSSTFLSMLKEIEIEYLIAPDTSLGQGESTTSIRGQAKKDQNKNLAKTSRDSEPSDEVKTLLGDLDRGLAEAEENDAAINNNALLGTTA